MGEIEVTADGSKLLVLEDVSFDIQWGPTNKKLDKSTAIGDLVGLRSGGPTMTIEGFSKGDWMQADEWGNVIDVTASDSEPEHPHTVHCIWFDGNKVKRGSFPWITLVYVGFH